jgi:sugar lactone lactonase YvrE
MRITIASLLLLSIAVAASATPPPPPRGQLGQSLGAFYAQQLPLGGSHIYLLEPSNFTATGSTSSKSILRPNANGAPVTEDANGNYYVTTAATTGAFYVTGDYTCDAGIPVYLYGQGGDAAAGGTNYTWNTAIGQMAYLGICPSTGVFPSNMFIYMDEASTIGMAYAVAGFATDSTHIFYNASALQGIQNAFGNINNLIKQSTGVALVTTSSGAVVSQQKINTLANVLALCVNDGNAPNGSLSTDCQNLFNTATSDGTTAGTIPQDTGTAAINIAHHAGANVQALYDMAPPVNQSPDAIAVGPVFTPYLTAQPNDFAVGITFSDSSIGDPWSIAIDGNGNAWIAGLIRGTTDTPYEGGSIVEISSSGTYLSPTGSPGGYNSSFFNNSDGTQTPYVIAIDASNNAWVGTESSLVILNSAGTITSTPLTYGNPPSGCSDGYAFDGGSGIAFDLSGNAWVTSTSIFKVDSSGNNQSGCGYTYSGYGYPIGLAVDSNNDIWIADYDADEISELYNNGQPVGAPYVDNSLQEPNGIAIDSQNNVWVANFAGPGVTKYSESLSEFTSPEPYGFTGYGLLDSAAVAIDGANNAWFAPNNNNGVGAVGLASNGVPISGTKGYATSVALENGQDAHYSIAIDGSGDVWVANTSYDTVTELFGAAAPTVTPVAPRN